VQAGFRLQISDRWSLAAGECCVLLGFLISGVAAGRLFEIRLPPGHVSQQEWLGIRPGELVMIEGHLISVPRRTFSGLQFELESTRIAPVSSGGEADVSSPLVRPHTVSGRIRLWLNAGDDFGAVESLRLRYGDSIRTLVSLRRPRVYHNPGSFDFRNWMESIEDVFWVGPSRAATERYSRRRCWAIDLPLIPRRSRTFAKQACTTCS
jgi:hypothetical protein